MEDNFSMDWGQGDGFGMIQVHYLYCALYFCYYYISSTSDHQELDPGHWGPCLRSHTWRLGFRIQETWPQSSQLLSS